MLIPVESNKVFISFFFDPLLLTDVSGKGLYLISHWIVWMIICLHLIHLPVVSRCDINKPLFVFFPSIITPMFRLEITDYQKIWTRFRFCLEFSSITAIFRDSSTTLSETCLQGFLCWIEYNNRLHKNIYSLVLSIISTYAQRSVATGLLCFPVSWWKMSDWVVLSCLLGIIIRWAWI